MAPDGYVFAMLCIVNLSPLINTEPVSDRFITSECFGSVLSLSCRRGHRIKIIDDFFGLSASRSGPGACHYTPGDCTITNNRYTSVIHRYCEGLESCTRFQVDRRNCGANLTNYEQVEYECVPDDDVINICSRVSMKSAEGYISTPNFPNEYTPNSHCRCTLRTRGRGIFVRLTFTQFIIKYDNPCKDWVEVLLDGDLRRLCGAYRSVLTGEAIDIVFHSDAAQGHQGFWLHFTAHPAHGNHVYIECGPERYHLPTTTITTSITTTTTTATTTLTNHDKKEKYIKPEITGNRKRGFTLEKQLAKQYKNEVYWKGRYLKSGETKQIVAWQTSTVGPKLPERKYNTGLKERDELRRHNSRITGIIIISICVGGIVLLVVILTVLLCINKRKHSSPAALAQKDKIQERLNSLSFYDSIPLYDSIGRNGGVARAPPVGGDTKTNGKPPDGVPYASGCKLAKSDAPYWTSLHAEFDSDHDSAVYAELERQSRDGLNEVGSPKSTHADTSASYSVSLDTTSDTCHDDISTHV